MARWVPTAPLVTPNPMLVLLARLAHGPRGGKTYNARGHAAYGRGVTSRSRGRRAYPVKAKKVMLMPKPSPAPEPMPTAVAAKERADDMDDDGEEKADAAPSRDYARSPSAPPPPAKPTLRLSLAGKSSGGYYKRRRTTPVVTLPWTDAGYRPPTLHPDLPAAAAKGYIFTLYAPGRHSVASNGSRRRIPLLRKTLKVVPTYRIVPGRSKRAYLMAAVKNTTGRPILRGHANLFAGAMFSGRSWLNTALPGREIKLPLGVDDAIKVERHLRQKTLVKGVFFKDDVTRYTVQIQVANHHRQAVQVEVHDQLPVVPRWAKKLEVKEVTLPGGMTRDKKTGQVTWKGTIKGSAVKKLSFSFNIVRPKDWEMRQHGG